VFSAARSALIISRGFDAAALFISFLGVQLFRRNAHAHFGLSRLDEHHQREHRTIGNPARIVNVTTSETVSASFRPSSRLRFQTLRPYGTPIRPIQGRSGGLLATSDAGFPRPI
jgi:hypothetical protein